MKKWPYFLLLTIFFSAIVNGQSTMTGREIYDFDVNDEFQFSHSNMPPNADRYIITGKHYSPDSSTVYYTRSFDNYISSVDYNGGPHLVYAFSSGIDSVSYSYLDSTIKNNYPVDSCNTASDTSYQSASHYCNMMVYERTHCAACCFEGQYYFEAYGKGLGQVTNNYSYPAYNYTNNYGLFYYKKGIISCGNKDGTTASIASSVLRPTIKVFPSPAVNTLNISNVVSQSYVKISDALGKVVLEAKISFDTSLDISDLRSGIYSVMIYNGTRNDLFKVVVSKQ
ncbi:MAG: T9SS type A sorting domain-containing protein [Bacteroidia bacterium]